MTDKQPDKGSPPPSLETILDDCWADLVRGKADRKHAYHLPVIATVDPDGLPAARTVVLRAADRDAGELRFHTDARSPKLKHLGARPTVLWHFYDKGSKRQLRVRSIATIHTDDALADEAWANTRLMSRRCYLAPAPPSTESDTPTPNLPTEFESRDPTKEESEAGRANFAVVTTRVDEIDWLWLRHQGHLRARFTRTDGGYTSTWLEP
ncbi:MAG: pyridoxamine 5'-phosphate oxidase family protein [Planctomycetota bacterium]